MIPPDVVDSIFAVVGIFFEVFEKCFRLNCFLEESSVVPLAQLTWSKEVSYVPKRANRSIEQTIRGRHHPILKDW